MDYALSIFVILLSSILVNNFIMSRFLGICPFLGVSKRVETAVGMGLAVTFVMALASVITYLAHYFILVPLKLEYMQTLAFILIIAALVQFVEMVIQKSSPSLYQALGVYLPLITTNCAVLGVAIINIEEGYDLFQTLINGVGG
ncbi:MAG: Rnf-Nqr domain containing protein, partial [Caldicoprobacterales bacterium]